MKKINLKLLVGCCALAFTTNVIAEIFPTTPPPVIPTLISELPLQPTTPNPSLYPGGATASLHVAIPYTTTGNVASAILNICLADDLSTNFPPNIDAPMEEALVTGITGIVAIPDASFDVQPNPFLPPTDPNVIIATGAGIENPNILPDPIIPCYPVDVTAAIMSNGAGTLSFDLAASTKYPDLFPGDPAYDLIIAIPGAPIEIPYHVWEDYVYLSANLDVTYAITPVQPENIPTLSEWSMIIMMLGLAGFGATRIRESS